LHTLKENRVIYDYRLLELQNGLKMCVGYCIHLGCQPPSLQELAAAAFLVSDLALRVGLSVDPWLIWWWLLCAVRFAQVEIDRLRNVAFVDTPLQFGRVTFIGADPSNASRTVIFRPILFWQQWSTCILVVTASKTHKKAVLSQTEPRDAAVNFDTYRILQ